MFFLEVKKLYRRKIFLIILVFSAIVSFYNINKVSFRFYTLSYTETEEEPYVFTDFLPRHKIDELILEGDIFTAELLGEKFDVYGNLLEDRRLLLEEYRSRKKEDAELKKEITLKSQETLYYFNDLSLENNSYDFDIKEQYNLGRFFRFGSENLFGIASLLLLMKQYILKIMQ